MWSHFLSLSLSLSSPLFYCFLVPFVSPSSLANSCKMPSTKNQVTEAEVQTWGMNEVCEWLKSSKLESCIEEFKSLQIDGQRLLVMTRISVGCCYDVLVLTYITGILLFIVTTITLFLFPSPSLPPLPSPPLSLSLLSY